MNGQAHLNGLDCLVHFAHALVANFEQGLAQAIHVAQEEVITRHGEEEGEVSDKRRPEERD